MFCLMNIRIRTPMRTTIRQGRYEPPGDPKAAAGVSYDVSMMWKWNPPRRSSLYSAWKLQRAQTTVFSLSFGPKEKLEKQSSMLLKRVRIRWFLRLLLPTQSLWGRLSFQLWKKRAMSIEQPSVEQLDEVPRSYRG